MSVDDEIDALKRVVGATTDMDLAEKLGVQRFAVSKWRTRGAVPAKYRPLYRQPTDADISAAMTAAFRLVMFGKKERSYWMAAVLDVLSGSLFQQTSEASGARGLRLERAVLDGMNLAMIATARHLGKEVCENDDDYRKLVQVLHNECADDFARIAARRQPPAAEG